ncbi:hypothetical protein F7D02_00060 [Escherichia coli]|nr:hypothetical protein [Escherichia coli]QEX71847.1 hypothetical protein F7D02_00060 [Escherichia coli]
MMTNGKSYKCLQIRIDRVNKAPLTATWGGISLARNKSYRNIVLVDEKDLLFYGRVERLKAILASECAICGSTPKYTGSPHSGTERSCETGKDAHSITKKDGSKAT